MQTLSLSSCGNILCLGAHADDIEIGCGGTILKLLDQDPDASVKWIIFSASPARRAEAEKSFQLWLPDSGRHSIEFLDFRDGYMPSQWEAIKDVFQREAQCNSPNVVLTHHLHDRHQDHRVIAELTWNAFRKNLILEYEIPKYEGDLGKPNFFVPLSAELAKRKLELLKAAFASQQEKYWYKAETFEALLRIRGVECRQEFAEAFHCTKVVLE